MSAQIYDFFLPNMINAVGENRDKTDQKKVIVNMVAGFSGHDEHLANVAKSQRIYFHFRHTLKKKFNKSMSINFFDY